MYPLDPSRAVAMLRPYGRRITIEINSRYVNLYVCTYNVQMNTGARINLV